LLIFHSLKAIKIQLSSQTPTEEAESSEEVEETIQKVNAEKSAVREYDLPGHSSLCCLTH
jgi:hypothetical protein